MQRLRRFNTRQLNFRPLAQLRISNLVRCCFGRQAAQRYLASPLNCSKCDTGRAPRAPCKNGQSKKRSVGTPQNLTVDFVIISIGAVMSRNFGLKPVVKVTTRSLRKPRIASRQDPKVTKPLSSPSSWRGHHPGQPSRSNLKRSID